jgi:hypothetical protein
MKEDFLHAIWEQQLFQKGSLLLAGKDEVKVIKTGFRNYDSGPDFSQAKIILGDLEWIGSVEIHVKSSEWNTHNHQYDVAYQSVILHVVWEKDLEIFRKDGTVVPTLEMKELVPLQVVLRYRSLVQNEKKKISCSYFLPDIQSFVLVGMQERVLVERLERKGFEILERFESNKKDWLETFFQTIAWCLGLKINAEPMLILSQSVPVKVLAAQGWKTESLAAIFLGVGGFLTSTNGPAGEKLKADYDFISQKYGLDKPQILWKMFRIRPGSFPIQRILLLAVVINNLSSWFGLLTEAESPVEFFRQIEKSPKPEILQSYLKESGYQITGFGISDFIRENLIINVFAPFLTALGLYQNQPLWIEKAIDWLNQSPAEENSITRFWKNENVEIKTAGQSQALTELFNNFCLPKKCMSCQIGTKILKTETLV